MSKIKTALLAIKDLLDLPVIAKSGDRVVGIVGDLDKYSVKKITSILNNAKELGSPKTDVAKLQQILTEIRARCFYLDSVLIEKLKELELAMAQNPGSGGGLTGPQGTGISQDTDEIVNLLSSQVDPELILDNLENSNKQKVIGYLYERGLTGYQIIKK